MRIDLDLIQIKKFQMNSVRLRYLFILVLSQLSLFIAPDALAITGAQTMTVDGRLYSSLTVDTPLLDSSVVLDIKILNPAGNCVIYEESQTVNTSATDGRFTILVGSAVGASQRVAGSNNAMATVFQNYSAIPGLSCTYTPIAGDARLMRITVAPSTTGSIEILAPDSVLDAVPNALIAESLQGLDRDHVLAIDSTTTLSQTNVANIFSSTNYPLLTALLGGTSTSYVSGSATGAKIPTVTSAPSSPAVGQIWFNSSANAYQYWNGSAVQQIGVSGSGISALTVGTSLTANGVAAGTLSSSGTIDLANSGVTAGTYTKVSVNSKGLVINGSGLVESDIPTLQTAGHVVGDAIVSGTIGGNTVFYSSGNVTSAGTVKGSIVSSGIDKTRQIQLFDPAAASTQAITFSSPTLTSGYSVVFPANQGAMGTTLTNDGSGNLSWSSGSAGSVSSVGLALPSIFNVTVPTVTSSGTLTATLANENANLIFAGPATGGANAPSFRALTANDLPAGIASQWATSGSTINYLAGFVGIGTATPQALLDINGTGGASAFLVPRDILSARPTGINGMLRYNTTLNAMETFANGSWASIATGATASSSQWTTSGSTIYYSSGNVGIGTTTSANALLSLGNNAGAGTPANLIQINNSGYSNPSANGTFADGDKIVFWNDNTVHNIKNAFGNDPYGVWLQASGDASSHFSVWTGPSGGIAPLERMRIDSAGKFGIGTITPVELFDVEGGNAQFDVSGAGAGSGYVKLFGGSSYINGFLMNNFGSTVISSNSRFSGSNNYYDAFGVASRMSLGAGTISFDVTPVSGFANNVITYTRAMTISSSGLIGVGTSSPQALLDIVGSGATSAIIVPRATIAQRPSTPVNGMIRYQIDGNVLEAYTNGVWSSLSTATSGASQWTSNGTSIYYSSGAVGIGTSTPSGNFQVMGYNTVANITAQKSRWNNHTQS